MPNDSVNLFNLQLRRQNGKTIRQPISSLDSASPRAKIDGAASGSRLWLVLGLLMAALWLAGCGALGPETTEADLMAQTRQIGEDYAADGNLAAAQAALEDLDVANPSQWLILAAETTISEGASVAADGLAQLVQAQGLHSTSVNRYLDGRNLATEPEAVAQGSQAPAPPLLAAATESPTPAPAPPTPTDTAIPPTEPPAPAPTNTPAPLPTATTPAGPEVQIDSAMNVRAGPGTFHPIRTTLPAGASAPIIGKNVAGDWWEIEVEGSNGWIYAPLVSTSGNTGGVAVAANIPTPPPATATPVPQPTAPPAPTATPAPAGPDFRLVNLRLWDVEENGGFLAGQSVNCGEKQVIRIEVVDAAGNPLNGVTVLGVYRNEAHTTGEKGPGIAEFDVNVDGDDVIVLRDVDGREVTSDRAKGLTAKTYNISFENLIAGRFCRDAASCQAFVDTHGCFGHFSWTAKFQRAY